MVEGQNQQSRTEIATEFEGGKVHLLDSSNAISDSATTISSNASTTTGTGDWSITHDNANGTTTLENSADIAFGDPGSFVLDQVVIESSSTTGDFIIDDSPTGDTDFSGDGDVTIQANDLTYTFGGE